MIRLKNFLAVYSLIVAAAIVFPVIIVWFDELWDELGDPDFLRKLEKDLRKW